MAATPNMNLKDQLDQLAKIQELDLQVKRLEESKAALPGQIAAVELKLKNADLEIKKQTAYLDELDRGRRQAVGNTELNSDRLTRSKAKLEGVENTHQYNAATKEIEQIERSNHDLKVQIEKFDESRLATETRIEGLKKQIEEFGAELAKEKDSVATQTKDFDRKLQELVKARTELCQGLDRRMLAHYDRVRGVKQGIGMSAATQGRCSACNMVVPPQIFIQVQKALELQTCASCHRVLYLPAPKA